MSDPVQTPAPGIDILNCGTGHTEVRIDQSNPIEIERAKRIITDMLRRGYVLFVEGPDHALTRVERFDPEKGVYIIADLGEPEIHLLPPGVEGAPLSPAAPEPQPMPTGLKRSRGRKAEVPMTSTRATAIARTAGG
jgi:hypothetical protein